MGFHQKYIKRVYIWFCLPPYTMLNTLLNWDRQAFYFINHTLGNPVFDLVLPWVREKLLWIPLYLFIIVFSLARYKLKGLYIILALIVAAAMSDLISAHLIKLLVQRLRPCNDRLMDTMITVRIACGNGYSFVSSHAANHFAVAGVLMGVFGRRWKWVIPASFTWAFMICFAQVYVGVHYPIDVTAGALLGWCIGAGIAALARNYRLLPAELNPVNIR